MRSVVIVSAAIGAGLTPDGTRPAHLVGGPADGETLELPTWHGVTTMRLRLLVDEQPCVYFSLPTIRAPRAGEPELYCWDDPDCATVAPELRERLAEVRRRSS